MTFKNVLRETLLSICYVVGMAAAGDAGIKKKMVLASNDGDRLYIMIMWLVSYNCDKNYEGRVYTKGLEGVWRDNSGKAFLRN